MNIPDWRLTAETKPYEGIYPKGDVDALFDQMAELVKDFVTDHQSPELVETRTFNIEGDVIDDALNTCEIMAKWVIAAISDINAPQDISYILEDYGITPEKLEDHLSYIKNMINIARLS